MAESEPREDRTAELIGSVVLMAIIGLSVACCSPGCSISDLPTGSAAHSSKWERSGRGDWLYSRGDLRARVRWVAYAREYRWEIYEASRPNRFLEKSTDSELTLDEAKEQAEAMVAALSYQAATK